MLAHCLSRSLVDLKRSYYPVEIILVELIRRFGINFTEHSEQKAVALFLRQLTQFVTVCVVALGFLKAEIVDKRAYIKSCAAGYYRKLSSCRYICDNTVCRLNIVGYRKAVVRVEKIHKVMRYALLFLLCGLCGGYVHTSVYLHRIC